MAAMRNHILLITFLNLDLLARSSIFCSIPKMSLCTGFLLLFSPFLFSIITIEMIQPVSALEIAHPQT